MSPKLWKAKMTTAGVELKVHRARIHLFYTLPFEMQTCNDDYNVALYLFYPLMNVTNLILLILCSFTPYYCLAVCLFVILFLYFSYCLFVLSIYFSCCWSVHLLLHYFCLMFEFTKERMKNVVFPFQQAYGFPLLYTHTHNVYINTIVCMYMVVLIRKTVWRMWVCIKILYFNFSFNASSLTLLAFLMEIFRVGKTGSKKCSKNGKVINKQMK